MSFLEVVLYLRAAVQERLAVVDDDATKLLEGLRLFFGGLVLDDLGLCEGDDAIGLC